MDLSLLTALVALDAHGTMAAAARSLAVSQPALHGQLARLSAAIGSPVYRRSGRGVELTDAGLRTLAAARDVERRLAELRSEVGGHGDASPVVLAAGEGAFLHLLGPAIRAFVARRRAPLRLLSRGGPAAIDAVRRGEAQLAVAAIGTVPDDLASDVVAKVGAAVLVPPRHRLARKRKLVLPDLEGERLVVPPAGAPHREAIARALEAAGVRWELAVEAQGWELFAHFARLGLGLAIVNAFPKTPAGLHARPLAGLPSVTYRALRRRGSALPPAAELLRADLVRFARPGV